MECAVHCNAVYLDAAFVAQAVVIAYELQGACTVRIVLVENACLCYSYPVLIADNARIGAGISSICLACPVSRELHHVPLIGSVGPVAPELAVAREDDLTGLLLYGSTVVESISEAHTVIVNAEADRQR